MFDRDFIRELFGIPQADMDDTDTEFIQDMIVHHQAAIDMATDYLNNSDPATRQTRVAQWAQQIATGQADEIERVTGWLKEAGKPITRNKQGGMNGMRM